MSTATHTQATPKHIMASIGRLFGETFAEPSGAAGRCGAGGAEEFDAVIYK